MGFFPKKKWGFFFFFSNYLSDYFSKTPEFLKSISCSRKVSWLDNASENWETLPIFWYRRVLGDSVCINDPALGTWSRDFNPVTCNLLRTPDQVSDKAGIRVSTFKFSAEVIGTGLEFGPWFYVVLNPVLFKIHWGAQNPLKTLV